MPTSLVSLLIFVAVFALVVFIHEFGHFVVARLLKVEVEEFGFGLPPRLTTPLPLEGHGFHAQLAAHRRLCPAEGRE